VFKVTLNPSRSTNHYC